LLIWDTRPIALQNEHRLRGLARLVYERCDVAQSTADLEAAFASTGAPAEIGEILAHFLEAQLMLHEDGRYLSLAVAGEYRLRHLKRQLEAGSMMPTRESPLLVHLATRMANVATARS